MYGRCAEALKVISRVVAEIPPSTSKHDLLPHAKYLPDSKGRSNVENV